MTGRRIPVAAVPASDEAAAHERIVDVLARLRAELEEIAGRIDRNQAAIARSTWAAGASDADYVRAMQDADLSAQRIAGVAGFLSALAEAAHSHWRIDTAAAAGALTLAGQARAIAAAGHEPQEPAEPGDVDLF